MPFDISLNKEEEYQSENSTPLASTSRIKIMRVPTVG